MREITQQGITTLKSGDRAAAFRLLATAVRQDPNDAQAWLWLSGAVDSDAARIDCMRQVLRIEPGNAAAMQGLAQLLKKQGGMEEDLTPRLASPTVTPSPSGKGGQEEAAEEPPAAEVETVAEPPIEFAPAPAPVVTSPVSVVDVSSSPFPLREGGQEGRSSSSQPGAARIYPEIDAMRAVYEQPDQTAEIETPMTAQAIADDLPEAALEEAALEKAAVAENAAAPIMPSYRPRTRPDAAFPSVDQKVVFKTRPSHVPALICFWIFFIGAYYIGAQFTEPDYVLGASIGFGLGIALELVIIYMIITNFRTRYTLTNHELRMHIIVSEGTLPHGRNIVIPVRDIYSAECRQNFLQQIMGIGDLYFDAAVGGQLAPMHLRGIPQCSQRAQQLLYLVREQHEPSNILTREVS